MCMQKALRELKNNIFEMKKKKKKNSKNKWIIWFILQAEFKFSHFFFNLILNK